MGIIQDALRDDPDSVLLEGNKLVKEEEVIEPADKPVVVEEVKDPSAEVEEPKKPVAPEPVNRAKMISELFEEDFEDEETAKTKYRTLKETATAAEQMKARLEELEAGVDPMKFFANENEYKRQMLLKQFPDYDPLMITRATTTDLTKMSALDVLKLQIRLKDGDIFDTDKAAEGEIEQKYGITLDDDFNIDELDAKVRNTILKDAKIAKGEFQTLRDSIKLPEKVDARAVSAEQKIINDQKIETLKTQYKPLLESIPGKLKEQKISFTEKDAEGAETVVFEYQIEDAYIDDVRKETAKTIDILAQRGVELNTAQRNKVVEESIQKLVQDYRGKNFDKILKAFKTKLDKDFADREVKEYHNPRSQKSDEPVKQNTATQESISKAESKIEARLRGERV